MKRGVSHIGILFGLPTAGILVLGLLQGITNGFTVTDILGGILTALVLLVIKRQASIDRAVAAIEPKIENLTNEIVRLRDSRHDLNDSVAEHLADLHLRVMALERQGGKDGS